MNTESTKELAIIGRNGANGLVSANMFATRNNPYHIRAKNNITDEQIAQVIRNIPLNGLQVPQVSQMLNESDIVELSESFVNTHFFNLAELGITVSINDSIDETREDQVIQELMRKYSDKTLGGQAASLHAEYASLRSVQNIFTFVRSVVADQKLEHQHLMLLASVNEVMQNLSINNRSVILQNLAEVCKWNGLRGRHRSPMALHHKYLPDLFMACPVWFIVGEGIADTTDLPDPRVDDAVKYFTSIVGTEYFADLFQMYNRRTRGFDKFVGPDLLSPHVAEAIPELKKKFDYLVIATPYHNVASQEWADPAWRANIDPYLIGFKRGLDYMVIIERWSGTGLFPLMTEMVADTIEHIKTHKDRLIRFSGMTYWHSVKKSGDSMLGDSSKLVRLANEIINNYAQGTLFDYLRTK